MASQHSSGTLLGSITLIAGTTIGAGILALPAVTLPAGILPSSLLMVAVWLYMAVSGLLIAEVTLHLRQQLGRPNLGLLATIQHSLGNGGAIAAGLLYVFIHYAMLIAYIARGGDLLAAALANLAAGMPVPLWPGHLLFVLLFGGIFYWGSEGFISRVNSVLLAVAIAAFTGLVARALSQWHPAPEMGDSWRAAIAAIPVMSVAFVYHNVVPVVATKLDGNPRKIRLAIAIGSLVPLGLFLVWNAAILGSVGVLAMGAVTETSVIDPVELLRYGQDTPGASALVSVFSEFAVATSFIGFVYGLLSVFEDVLADIFSAAPTEADLRDALKATVESGVESETARMPIPRLSIYGLVLIPPLGLSVLSPDIFYRAIEWAGAFGNSLLFGMIPAVMAWKQRYTGPAADGQLTGDRPGAEQLAAYQLVPGGKTSLAIVIGVAAAVVAQAVLFSL